MNRKFASALVIALACQTGAASLAAPALVLAQAEKPAGSGVLNAIDLGKRTLNITHRPIPALHWPGMTMDFRVAPEVDLSALKPGDKIAFSLGRNAEGFHVIEDVRTVE